MIENTTIAAIATGLTESGIGIIRISGPESIHIIKKIFRTKKGNIPDFSDSHRVRYGYILKPEKTASCTPDALQEASQDNSSAQKTVQANALARKTAQANASARKAAQAEVAEDREGCGKKTANVSRETILDEVLVLNMKAPHSYTGEDTVEIDCHGGVLMMKRILDAVIQAGARLAEPGGFTKRAFLNGRLDLNQAEAVIDVINAKNDRALRASVAQLRGSVSEKIRQLREKVLEDTAYIEAALDDPEHIELEGFSEKLQLDVAACRRELQYLIASGENGRIVREGIKTVIVGKPNAGKSSLLNALVGAERAIVTEIAGTTRDTLEEQINLGGITLQLIDTAGIRKTEDAVEKIGVERALSAAEDADLAIYVADASIPLDPSDIEILQFLSQKQKKTIVLLNKKDLKPVLTDAALTEQLEALGMKQKETQILSVSAKYEQGIEALSACIEQMFYQGDISANDEIYLSSARQREALLAADEALSQVEGSLEAGMSEDFFTIDLMNAYAKLGLVLGEEADEDLINEIFSKFCMGK